MTPKATPSRIQIFQDIFTALENDVGHNIQELSHATRHTWMTIKRALATIELIQSKRKLVKNGKEYTLHPPKEE